MAGNETLSGLSRQDSIPMWVVQHLSLTESYLWIKKKKSFFLLDYLTSIFSQNQIHNKPKSSYLLQC